MACSFPVIMGHANISLVDTLPCAASAGTPGSNEGENSNVDSAAGMIATAMANLDARATAVLGAGQFNVAQGGVQVISNAWLLTLARKQK